jgi:hypothetical protein
MPWPSITNDTTVQEAMQKAFDKLEMVILSDWNHLTSQEVRDISVAANIDPFYTDSVLINCKGSINCQDLEFIESFIPPPIPALLGSGLVLCLGMRSIAVRH